MDRWMDGSIEITQDDTGVRLLTQKLACHAPRGHEVTSGDVRSGELRFGRRRGAFRGEVRHKTIKVYSQVLARDIRSADLEWDTKEQKTDIWWVMHSCVHAIMHSRNDPKRVTLFSLLSSLLEPETSPSLPFILDPTLP